jgi:hypothetical protein
VDDLLDVQAHALDSIGVASSEAQREEAFARALYEVTAASYRITDAYQTFRFVGKLVDDASIRQIIRQAGEWMTVIYHCLDVDVPEFDDIEMFSTSLDDTVAADAVLLSLVIHGAVAELGIEYYCSGGGIHPDIAEDNLEEIMGALELLAQRAGSSLESILVD